MKAGAEHANKTGTPIAIDPVGAGISRLRNDLIKDLVLNYDVKSIRGNMSEIKAIANLIELDILQDSKSQSGKGVDVAADDIISKETLKKNGIIVKELAKELNVTSKELVDKVNAELSSKRGFAFIMHADHNHWKLCWSKRWSSWNSLSKSAHGNSWRKSCSQSP